MCRTGHRRATRACASLSRRPGPGAGRWQCQRPVASRVHTKHGAEAQATRAGGLSPMLRPLPRATRRAPPLRLLLVLGCY